MKVQNMKQCLRWQKVLLIDWQQHFPVQSSARKDDLVSFYRTFVYNRWHFWSFYDFFLSTLVFSFFFFFKFSGTWFDLDLFLNIFVHSKVQMKATFTRFPLTSWLSSRETGWFLTSEGSSVRSRLVSVVLQLAIRNLVRTSRAHLSRPPAPAHMGFKCLAAHTSLTENYHLPIEPDKAAFIWSV